MEIKKETIDKYVRFLNLVKKQEGKELSFKQASEMIKCSSKAHYFARDAGLIEFKGNKVTKVNFKVAEPIHARRLIEAMYTSCAKKEDKPEPKAPVKVESKVESKKQETKTTYRIFGIPVFSIEK